MERYKAFTVTHKQFKAKELGKLLPDFDESTYDFSHHLNALKEKFSWDELFFLNTCNRILFFTHTDQEISNKEIEDVYKSFHPSLQDQDLSNFVSGSQIMQGAQAVSHLFKVASSVDSLVVGEREVLAQIKSAYQHAVKSKLSGDSLRMLLEKAINVAKEVYRETKIGENPISVVALSIRQVLKLNPPKDARIVLVGAGQTMRLVSKYLKKHDFSNFVIYNRTVANAASISKTLNATAKPIDELVQHSGGFDILIAATTASKPILTEAIYDQVAGDGSAKILVDLSVPNNIESSLANRENVSFIGVDQLRGLAAENLSLRKAEVSHAEEIIEQHTESFAKSIKVRRVERAMNSIPEKIKEIKHRAVDEVYAKDIASMDASSKETLQKVVDYLEKKYIGIPMRIAKQALEQELDLDDDTSQR